MRRWGRRPPPPPHTCTKSSTASSPTRSTHGDRYRRSIVHMFAAVYRWCLTSLGLDKKKRVVMVGLDGAGKTTILYRLKLGEIVTTTMGMPNLSHLAAPTGPHMEKVTYKRIEFLCWDLGGSEGRLRREFLGPEVGPEAVIFVVDLNDRCAPPPEPRAQHCAPSYCLPPVAEVRFVPTQGSARPGSGRAAPLYGGLARRASAHLCQQDGPPRRD